MKKILGILIFNCLFFNNIAAADYMAKSLLNFNEWLSVNGHDQYLDKELTFQPKFISSKSYKKNVVLLRMVSNQIYLTYPI